MSKKVTVRYDYIINCFADLEVDEDFDIDDEDKYDEIELPDDTIVITINGEYYDCDLLGVSHVMEFDE